MWDHLPSPQKMWLRWARIITRKPLMYVIPAIAYACMLPCIIPLAGYEPNYDIEVQGIRHDVIESKALTQFERQFSLQVGMLEPLTLVIEAQHLGQEESQNHTGDLHRQLAD